MAEVDTEELLRALNALPDKIAKSIKASTPSGGGGVEPSGGGGGGGINVKLPGGSGKGGLFGDAANKAMGAIGLAGDTLSSSIAGFADNVTNMGGLVTDLATSAQYLDDTADVFQSISKVGAGLNGDLGALRATAAQARLPLDSFANIVANNAEQLAGFAGGVEEGTRRAAQLGKAMFETGAIDGFMNLGYSIEEANEFLVENTELIRRQSRLTGMTAAQEVAAAQELAKQFDIVAKLTGKSAKQQKDDLVARQRDGATQARLRLMEMDGVTNAQEAYTAAQSKLAAGPKVLQNLFDDIVQTGVPMTEATKNFAATNAAAYQLALDAKAALDRGDTEEAERLSAEAVKAASEQANSRAGLTLATLAQTSDIAQGQATVLEETAPLIDAIQANADRMGKELGRTVSFTESFNNILESLTSTQTDQLQGALAGQEAQQLVNESRQAIANANSEIAQTIGENVSTSQKLTDTFTTIANSLEERFSPGSNGLQALRNIVEETIPGFGDQLSKQIEIAKEQGTISEATAQRAKELAAVFEDVSKSSAERTAAMNELNAMNLGGAIQQAIEALPTRREVEAEVDAEGGVPENNERGFWDRVWESVGDFVEPLTSAFSDEKVNVTSSAPTVSASSDEKVNVTSSAPTVPAMPNFSNMTVQSMTPNVNALNLGNVDISPKLDQLNTSITELSQSLSNSPNSPDMQKNMLEKLDTLDQSMQQLVAINNKQQQTGEKQYKQTRANGRDVYSGVG